MRLNRYRTRLVFPSKKPNCSLPLRVLRRVFLRLPSVEQDKSVKAFLK